jgi:putative flippase GtrA
MNQSALHQMIRYVMVGAVVYACDMAVFWAIITLVPQGYLPANVAAKMVGATVGFVLHKYVTFSWQQKSETTEQVKAYILLFIFNITLSTVLLWLLVSQFHAPEILAKICTDIVVIVTSFFVSRHFVYRSAHD